jgi:hypothetical protein
MSVPTVVPQTTDWNCEGKHSLALQEDLMLFSGPLRIRCERRGRQNREPHSDGADSGRNRL